jgi:hypothetical protein
MTKFPRLRPRVAIVLHHHNSPGSRVVTRPSQTDLCELGKHCDNSELAFLMREYSETGIRPFGCKHRLRAWESPRVPSRFANRIFYLNSSAG